MVPVVTYVSFDVVPAPKGSSTHIAAFTRALARAFGRVDLVTVSGGPEVSPALERWPGVFHTELPALGHSLIDRVLCFRGCLRRWMENQHFRAIHFRSIFEGMVLIERKSTSKLIYEINGLPSVELKYRYPGVLDDPELMRKLQAQESACLRAADLVLTPSEVTRNFLNPSRPKIQVIPNGVDLQLFLPCPKKRTNRLRMLYFGTLASWQGVDLAVRALAQIAAEIPATLQVVGVANGKQREDLVRLANKLQVAQFLEIGSPVSQAELVTTYLHNSDVVLAPLAWNDRNVVQGCCPLKILEAMAVGVPVIATDLLVTRELGVDGEHLLLVKPGSVDQIARAALRVAREPGLAGRLGDAGRSHVERYFTWDRAGASLVAAYEALGIRRASTD